MDCNIEQALVTQNNNGKKFVVFKAEKNCGHCHGCGICSMGGQDESIELPLDNPEIAETGKIVNIEIISPGKIISSLILFALPLLGTLAGGFTGYIIYNNPGMVGGGIIGLFLAFMLAWLLSKSCFRVKARIIPDNNL